MTSPGTLPPPRDTVAILLAAGVSARMNGEDKLWADLGGSPVLAHPLRMLAGAPGIARIVVVAPAARHAEIDALARDLPLSVGAVEGGATRQASVAAGLGAAAQADNGAPQFIVVHDAARPLATRALAARVLEAARVHGAAIPVVAVADTIKQVTDDGLVVRTLDRSALRAAQTPQAFATRLLQRAHAAAAPATDATDDAGLLEAQGILVHTVEGESTNFKLTTPSDLVLVRALLATRSR